MQTINIPKLGEMSEEHGGIFAGIIMRGYNCEYGLIVAPGEEGQIKSVEWGPYGEEIKKANSNYNGELNTQAIIDSGLKCPAAEWANQLTLNDYSDWYLPAQKELNLCYVNAQDAFEKDWHWSSTQSSAYYAWIQSFGNGYQNDYRKGYALRARAVRRFIINSSI